MPSEPTGQHKQARAVGCIISLELQEETSTFRVTGDNKECVRKARKLLEFAEDTNQVPRSLVGRSSGAMGGSFSRSGTRSLCCKYEDLVAMVPLPAINSFVIKKWYDNLANLELLEDDEEGSSKKEEFLQLLNRGGLVTPIDLVYLTCMHALQLKAELFDDDYTQELFLASSFPQAVFVNILTKKISNTSTYFCISPY
ncbi:Uncharacterized protein FKW44_007143 [Caligus rogercresseyi]|uniref:Uncharacterized protein n=1 Tax=Caligus rogercresseyi TaxID=217165 RepID=A0A7T8QTB8_CALRO|nr:Uncharacterized protein FKW44_007143 [Caligus rogercresseyi]